MNIQNPEEKEDIKSFHEKKKKITYKDTINQVNIKFFTNSNEC